MGKWQSNEHTQEPWGYRRHLPNTKVTDDPHRLAMQDFWYMHGARSDSDFLADVFMIDDEHSLANIRLMAAAPDLLAALRDLLFVSQAVAHSERLCDSPELIDFAKHLRASLTKARAALALVDRPMREPE